MLVLIGVLCLTLPSFGQTMKDLNDALSHRITYDEAFNPTLNLTVKNVFSRVITTIEVVVLYEGDPYDWMNAPEIRTAQIRLLPGGKGTAHIQVPAEKDLRKPKSFYISKVRFEDGTICDK